MIAIILIATPAFAQKAPPIRKSRNALHPGRRHQAPDARHRRLHLRDPERARERLQPPPSPASQARGAAYAEKGEHDKAIADFDQAIEQDPKNGAAYHNRALSYMDTGKVDRALADFDQVIKIDAKSALAYYSRAATSITTSAITTAPSAS